MTRNGWHSKRRVAGSRGLLLVGLFALAAGAGAAGWWWSRREPAVEPPTVSTAGLDSHVAVVLQQEVTRVRAEPRSAAAWGRLGHVYLAHQFGEAALACFREAHRLDPKDPAWVYLPGIYYIRRDPDEARACMREALALSDRAHPEDQTIRLRLIELLLSLNEVDEADEQLRLVEKAEAPEPGARARCYRGLIESRRGNWQRAYELLLPLAADADENAARRQITSQLAAVCLQLGRTTEAKRYARTAGEAKEDEGWEDPYVSAFTNLEVGRQARFEQLRHLERNKDLREAISALRQMIEESGGKDSLAFYSLASNLAKVGQFKEADATIRRALDLVPKQYRANYMHSTIQYDWGVQAAKAGDADGARAHFRESVEAARRATAAAPLDSFGHLQLALGLIALERREDAVAALQRAASIRPEEFRVQLLLGETLAELGRKDEARGHIERATAQAAKLPEQDPAAVEARAKLAQWRQRWHSGP